jgi:predicted nucleotide-binding protein (sugar kinase/HSP70/actin superfamily)
MADAGTGNGGRNKQSLKGRTLQVPQMSHGGAVAFAAAFRSVGIDARVSPDSDAHTLDLGGRYTSGEECLPARVTLGNFLKVTEQPDFAPEKTAFFMPTAEGPCRFGQYAPYIRKVLKDIGLGEVMVFSPSSENGYEDMGKQVNVLMRNALRGLIAADILRKMLHKTRPYEISKGDTDLEHTRSLAAIEKVLEQQGMPAERYIQQLIHVLTEARDRFRKIRSAYTRERPLVGVVGEIFCRLTPFTNDHAIRKLEEYGAECALAHIVEWVWYTNLEQQKRLRVKNGTVSLSMLGAKIKNYIQHKDEHRLYGPFREDFRGYDEPQVEKIWEYGEPYLPHWGALGEMNLSTGKAVYHYYQGCDGVVDISPFTCMNGIVTEAVFPRISRDHDNIPIRNFFFDGTQTDLDRDVGIFMELVRTYKARKRIKRIYPAYFPVQ